MMLAITIPVTHMMRNTAFHQSLIIKVKVLTSTQKNPFYGDKKDTPQEGNLMGKILKDHHRKIHHARYYNYDDHGNVTSIFLYGQLTGKPKT